MPNQVNLDRVKSAVNFLSNLTDLPVPSNEAQWKILALAIREASLLAVKEANNLWELVYEAGL